MARLWLCLLVALVTGCSSSPRAGLSLPLDAPVDERLALMPVSRWEAERPRAVVVAFHSFRDYRLAWQELALWLNERDVTLVAGDQRGHGEWPKGNGRVQDRDQVVADAVALIRDTRARYGAEVPLVLLGESMGASTAVLAAVALGRADAPDALVLSGPGLRGGLPFRGFWDFSVGAVERLMPGLTLTIDPEYDGVLSPAATARFAEDPRVIRRVRADTYAEVVWLAQAATDRIDQLDVPVLYLWGGQDRTIPLASVCDGAARHPSGQVAVWTDDDWPHLVMQRRKWQETATDVFDWVDAVLHGRDGHKGLYSEVASCGDET